MPRLDGTGPLGLGPRTGRGLGPCGMGMGWRCPWLCSYNQFVSPKNELAALEQEEKMLEEELSVIREEKANLKDQQK